MTTDTSERGLERLICRALTGSACDPETGKADAIRERPATYGAGKEAKEVVLGGGVGVDREVHRCAPDVEE